MPDRLEFINSEQIKTFLGMNFRRLEGDYAVMFRGIGERGTAQEAAGFLGNLSLPLDAKVDDLMPAVERTVRRWAQYNVATCMVPAAMDPSILADNKGTVDRVKAFTTICVDLDRGRPSEALAYLTQHISRPTMVVESGGTTEEGEPKLHLWWALSEPTDEIAKVARLRELLALRVGGDPSFKRATQVIRVPGTVYAKGGVAKQCRILSYDEGREIHL